MQFHAPDQSIALGKKIGIAPTTGIAPTVGLASTSSIKRKALEAALKQLSFSANINGVKANSRVPEQPFGIQTLIGAMNRANHAAELLPVADLTVAIESGLFKSAEGYYDKAIVVIRLKYGEFIVTESHGVEFPSEAVEETIRRGPHVWTCGKVLKEWNLVEQDDDPHLSLVGTSRADFMSEAVLKALSIMLDRLTLTTPTTFLVTASSNQS